MAALGGGAERAGPLPARHGPRRRGAGARGGGARLLDEGDNAVHAPPVYLTLVWCLREQRRFREAIAAAEEGLQRAPDAVLAQWATQVAGRADRGREGALLCPRSSASRATIDVRFADMDSLGHVNNAVYLTYFEPARMAYWMHVTGRSRPARHGHDPRPRGGGLPLPARSPETVEVGCACASIGRTSFVLEQDMHERKSGRLVAEARKVLVHYDYAILAPGPDRRGPAADDPGPGSGGPAGLSQAAQRL